MVTQVRMVETREQALRRLLTVARESGVKLLRDQRGDVYATSVSEPGWLYPVTPESCGCRGFATCRRCRHVAALWSHLGYFDPEPETLATCSTCNGTGTECGTVACGRGWRYEPIVCASCHGTGQRAA